MLKWTDQPSARVTFFREIEKLSFTRKPFVSRKLGQTSKLIQRLEKHKLINVVLSSNSATDAPI